MLFAEILLRWSCVIFQWYSTCFSSWLFWRIVRFHSFPSLLLAIRSLALTLNLKQVVDFIQKQNCLLKKMPFRDLFYEQSFHRRSNDISLFSTWGFSWLWIKTNQFNKRTMRNRLWCLCIFLHVQEFIIFVYSQIDSDAN